MVQNLKFIIGSIFALFGVIGYSHLRRQAPSKQNKMVSVPREKHGVAGFMASRRAKWAGGTLCALVAGGIWKFRKKYSIVLRKSQKKPWRLERVFKKWQEWLNLGAT